MFECVSICLVLLSDRRTQRVLKKAGERHYWSSALHYRFKSKTRVCCVSPSQRPRSGTSPVSSADSSAAIVVAINLLQWQLQGKKNTKNGVVRNLCCSWIHILIYWRFMHRLPRVLGGSCTLTRTLYSGRFRTESECTCLCHDTHFYLEPAWHNNASNCGGGHCFKFQEEPLLRLLVQSWQSVADGLISRDNPDRLETSTIATCSPFNVRAGVTLTYLPLLVQPFAAQ